LYGTMFKSVGPSWIAIIVSALIGVFYLVWAEKQK
jgi:hypothetical protein